MTEQADQQAFWERLHLPPPGAAMPLAAYDALPETTIPMEYIHGRVVYPHWNETSMTPPLVPVINWSSGRSIPCCVVSSRMAGYTVGDTFRSLLLQQTVTVSDLFDID